MKWWWRWREEEGGSYSHRSPAGPYLSYLHSWGSMQKLPHLPINIQAERVSLTDGFLPCVVLVPGRVVCAGLRVVPSRPSFSRRPTGTWTVGCTATTRSGCTSAHRGDTTWACSVRRRLAGDTRGYSPTPLSSLPPSLPQFVSPSVLQSVLAWYCTLTAFVILCTLAASVSGPQASLTSMSTRGSTAGSRACSAGASN